MFTNSNPEKHSKGLHWCGCITTGHWSEDKTWTCPVWRLIRCQDGAQWFIALLALGGGLYNSGKSSQQQEFSLPPWRLWTLAQCYPVHTRIYATWYVPSHIFQWPTKGIVGWKRAVLPAHSVKSSTWNQLGILFLVLHRSTFIQIASQLVLHWN